MRRISLNHALSTSSRHWFATTLFVSGCCLNAFSLLYLQQLNNKNEQLRQSVQDVDTKLKSKTPSENRTLEPDYIIESNLANTAIEEILLPWPSIFKALEVANLDEIKILLIEPNMKSRSVHIVAIVLGDGNMMTYIKRLNQQSLFKQVNLTSTESVEVVGQAATQFELNIFW
jgi:hypothetical protein